MLLISIGDLQNTARRHGAKCAVPFADDLKKSNHVDSKKLSWKHLPHISVPHKRCLLLKGVIHQRL